MMIEESSERKGHTLNTKFTVLDGERRYKRISWGPAPLPPCQAHLIDGSIDCSKEGEYDSPTTAGPWADLCATHAIEFAPAGTSLGYHRVTVK